MTSPAHASPAAPPSPAARAVPEASSPLRTGSVRTRTIVAVIVLLALLLGALAIAVDTAMGARLRAQIEERLSDRAAAAAALVGTVDSDALAERLSAQGLSVRIQSASGDEVVAGPSPEQLRAGPPDIPGRPGEAPREAPRTGTTTAPAASEAVSVTASTFSGDDQLTTLTSELSDGSTLTLTASTASIDDTLTQLRWTMAAASVVVLLLGIIGVIAVVRRSLRPLDRVTTVARSIAGGDRGRRLRPSRPSTEIGRVASAFDEMLDDIEGAEASARDAEARMRAFVSDAAHELRTPVAGMRAAADTLVRSELSAADREELAGRVAREAGRAARLIDDMLMMARLDRGLDLQPTRTDLGVLVRAEVDRQPLRHPGLRVQIDDRSASVQVDVDAERIGQVLANLLDNAARAGGRDGVVAVGIDRSARGVIVSVTDEGPGVPAGERERIFERLVRLDPARSGRAGAGLGLPIARGIARAHGGDVVCADAPRGARFELILPAPGL